MVLFSCVGDPGNFDTLPRNQARHPHATRAKAVRSHSTPLPFGSTAQARQRPAKRRLTKGMIASPTNFQHLTHTGKEDAADPAALEQIKSALASPLDRPTSFSAAPAMPKRKPAPAVTPSVIRAVPTSHADARHLPPVPPTFKKASTSPLPSSSGLRDPAMSLSPSLAAIVRGAVDEELTEVKEEPGVTATAQRRYDGAMKEIVDALKVDGPDPGLPAPRRPVY